MHSKWYFQNDPIHDFSEKPSFTPKSSWKPPKGQPNLEVFLSDLEKQISRIVDSKLGYSNFSKEESQAMWALADNRSIVIKKADKGSTVGVWDSNDYILEAGKQLNDANVYKDVFFNEKNFQELVGTSNQLFQNLKSKGKISDKQLKYFTYEYKKVSKVNCIFYLVFTRVFIRFLGDV